MSKKKQPEQAETEQTEAKQASEEKTEQPAEAKTPAADWEAKYNDLNDRYLRMAAEYDNFRKRSQREREQARKNLFHRKPSLSGVGVGADIGQDETVRLGVQMDAVLADAK